ncbi:hypothetical protein N9164_16930 [Draconibacterium sp.]|nr:hypothetical protein [Draconibacterium sp.]
MKKLLLILSIMLLAVTPTVFMPSCNLITGDEKCEMTKMDDENRTFSFKGKVIEGTKGWQGTIKVVFYKTYCDGDVNGRKEFDVNTDSDGTWKLNYEMTYTYKNYDDFVTLEIYNESDGGKLIHTHHWNWQAVDTEHYYTHVVYESTSYIR